MFTVYDASNDQATVYGSDDLGVAFEMGDWWSERSGHDYRVRDDTGRIVTRSNLAIQLGPDIDLDAEEIYLDDGTRLTEAVAERMGVEAAERARTRRGRPSISPQL